jgi:hypothetical protein
MKLMLMSLFFAAQSFTQPISFGFKAGIPLDRAGGNDDTRTEINKQRWTVGPTVEVRISPHFSAGADALYRRLGYSSLRSAGSASFFENSSTAHWEVPVYLKYRRAEGTIRPFVLGGAAFEHATVSGTAGCTGDAMLCGEIGIGAHELKSSSWGGGYLVGGGIEFRVGRIVFAPEFRYTRWVRGYFSGAGSDQPAVLFGIRFQP